MPITGPWRTLEPYPEVNLAQFLEAIGTRFGDKAAAISPDGKEYSFSLIINWSKKVARFLQDEGVAKGDRVGIFSPNCAARRSPRYGWNTGAAQTNPVKRLYSASTSMSTHGGDGV